LESVWSGKELDMNPRPIGVVIGVIGAVVIAISALADTLGIGEGHTFGWLQILGVVVGVVILLLGLVIATEWVPLPRRGRKAVATGPQSATTQPPRAP
jgi:hypothetical protein